MSTATIKVKLTKAYVDKIQPPTDKPDEWHYDLEVPGFAVRVQLGGSKTYVARYRTLAGTPRKMKLARTCDMHPDKARDMAKDVFVRVAKGEDPALALQEIRNAPTLKELRDKFMTEHSEKFKKPNSQRSDKANWDNHVLPTLGATTKVRDIDEAHILKLKGKLADKQATANQCIALMSKALNLAEVWKMRPRNSNPCRGIGKFEIQEKELILSPDQMKALNCTLLTMTVTGDIKADFADFIRLLMLTGCRRSEIMHAKASWIDLHQGLLLLPDTKTGQRRIPLVGEAYNIAEALVADGREWLIPGQRKGQPLQTPYKVWKKVKQRAGIPLALRLHDLRHTAGSWAHLNGATQKEIQVLLGHKQMSTTERYIHAPVGSNLKTSAVLGNVITGAWGQPTEAQAA
jgi:integrase